MPEFRTKGGFKAPAEAPPRKRRELIKEGIDQELSIDDLHLNEELMDQALLMRKYTKQKAGLEKKAASIKNQLELAESDLKIKLSNDGKGRKVAEIEAMVVADPKVQELKIQLFDAEEEVGEYEGIVKAIAQRAEMLKDLSANLRKEIT